MALDTVQKRLAVLGGALPPPDGTLDASDRAQLLDLFSFADVVVPEQPLPAPDVVVDFDVLARASPVATVESPALSPANVAARSGVAFDVEIGQ